MMYHLNYQSKIPIFTQIVDQTIQLVGMKVLTGDDALPSVRSLATELGINPNTVAKAYQELERMGVIYTAVGKGSFVRANYQLSQEFISQQLIKAQELLQQCLQMGIAKSQLQQMINDLKETNA